jgi:hypothetical protein
MCKELRPFQHARYWSMASSWMLRCVTLVRTDVSEERSASFIRVTRINELGTTLAVTSNQRTLRRNAKFFCRLLVTASLVPSPPILVTLMKEALRSSETSVITRATRRNIPQDAILLSHRRKNLKFYIALYCVPLRATSPAFQWKETSLQQHNFRHVFVCITCMSRP